jgi:hypothetical protein
LPFDNVELRKFTENTPARISIAVPPTILEESFPVAADSANDEVSSAAANSANDEFSPAAANKAIEEFSPAAANKANEEFSPAAANKANEEFSPAAADNVKAYQMVQPAVQYQMAFPAKVTRRLVTDGRNWGHDVEIKCSLVWLTDGESPGQASPDVNLYIDYIEPDTGNTTRRLSVRSEADNNLLGMSDTMREFMLGLVAAEQVQMEYIHWTPAPIGFYKLWVSSTATQNLLTCPFEVRITIKDGNTFAVKTKQRFESIGGGEEKLAFEADVSRTGKWRLHKVINSSQVSKAHVLCQICICAARILLG